MGTVGRYKYGERLNRRQIRLIQIRPEGENSLLQCELVERNLDLNPEYNALSYVWGDHKDTVLILCDGLSLEITRSAYDALLRLRTELEFDLLWIDAICINQVDIEEKNMQVRMMTEIYAKSLKVIIWLGNDTLEDHTAISLIRQINAEYGDPRRWENRQTPSSPESSRIANRSNPDWNALFRFYSKPWFYRIWVIQELCAGTNCVFRCGAIVEPQYVILGAMAKAISFPRLRGRLQAGRSLSNTSYFDTDPAEGNALTLWTFKQDIENRKPAFLTMLLRSTATFQFTDQRDRIFALVGLASDAKPDLVNYRLDYREVLIDTAIRMFSSPHLSSPLDVLSYKHGASVCDGLPSWVPEWRWMGYAYCELCLYFPSTAMRMERPADFEYSVDLGLRIKGHVIDEVKSTIAENFTVKEIVKVIEEEDKISLWNRKCTQLVATLGKYPTGEAVQEAHWRTLLLNLPLAGSNEPPPSEYAETIHAYIRMHDIIHEHKLFAKKANLYYLPFLSSRVEPVSAYLDWMFLLLCILTAWCTKMWPRTWLGWTVALVLNAAFHWCGQQIVRHIPGVTDVEYAWKEIHRLSDLTERTSTATSLWSGRAFGITQNGYMGWFHRLTQPGDKICIFHGSRLPFVIRPTDTEGEYLLLGDSYIHGIMYGEPFVATAGKEDEVITLVLDQPTL